MDLSLLQFLFLFIMVGFAGFIDSIAGGGGLITITTYLALGIPSDLILGTNKCVSTTGGSVSIFRYIKSGAVNLKIIVYGIIAGLVGSSIGASLAQFLSNENMIYILLAVVPLVLILNYFKSKILIRSGGPLVHSQLIVRCTLIGLIIGAYDGFFGPGTGTFLIFAMFLFMNMEMREASASARVINFTSNIAAFFVFLLKGLIAWKIAAVAIVASMIGNFLGSGFVVSGNVKMIKHVFNFVLISLLAKSIYDLVHM